MERTFAYSKIILLLVLTVGLRQAGNAQVIYVKANATGLNNGSSWANAYITLTPAIAAASGGQQIWVASGTYSPAAGLGFVMKAGVSILGGFSGTETAVGQRNWTVNPTTLLGNGSSVIRNNFTLATALPASAVLDGFYIEKGNAANGGGIYNYYASPTLNNLSISSNTATNLGGGFYCYMSNPSVSNTTLAANRSSQGGGMYISFSDPVLSGLAVQSNTAANGGGLYSVQSSFTLSSSSVLSNTTGNYAGGIMMTSNSTLTINDCRVENNSTGIGGGGIVNGGILTVNNSTVAGNMAHTGAAVQNHSFTSCTFSNSAVFSNTATTFAGAFYNNYCLFSCSGSTIEANIGVAQGGGMINLNATVTIGSTILKDNWSHQGGAMFSSSSQLSIGQSSFITNGTSWHGGAMHNASCNPVLISDCDFNGNSALSGDGGALYNYLTSTHVSNSSFSANTTGVNGGAIANFTCDPVFINVSVSNNTASARGGGIFNSVCSPTMINVTINGNQAEYGGGIFNRYSYGIISNSILFGNSALQAAPNLANGVSSPTVFFSLIGGSGGSKLWQPVWGTNGGGNIDAASSPFVTGTNELVVGSAAINAGLSSLYTSTVASDQQGNPRVIDCSIDMGANEFQFISDTPPISITGRTVFCEGDSVVLTANALVAGEKYKWNNASTSQSIIVKNSGTYSVEVVSANGSCINSTSISVFVNPLPQPVISATGNVLSTGTFSLYQWYREDIEIDNAITQNYAPETETLYSVRVTDDNGCSATSPYFHYYLLGIHETHGIQNSAVFPMPVTDFLNIVFENPFKGKIQITDLQGRMLEEIEGNSPICKINTSHLLPGIYFVVISEKSDVVIHKIIKE